MNLNKEAQLSLKIETRIIKMNIVDFDGKKSNRESFEVTGEHSSGDKVIVRAINNGESFVIEVQPDVLRRPEIAHDLLLAVMGLLNPPTDLSILNKPVSGLGLSVLSENCLQNANIEYVGELVQKTEEELLKKKCLGRRSLKEIKRVIRQLDLSLGMDVGNWVPPHEPTKPAET